MAADFSDLAAPPPRLPGPAAAVADHSDLAGPAQPAGADFADLSQPAPVVNAMHPELRRLDRAKVMNLAPEPATAVRYLEQKGFEVQNDGGWNLKIRRPGEDAWHRVDPKGLDWGDISDLFGDMGSMALSGLGAVGAAAVAAPTTPLGMIAAGSAGAAGGAGAASAIKSGLGKLAGLPVEGGEAAKAALEDAAGYGLGEAAFGLGGQAIKAARPYVAGLLKEAPQAARTAAAGTAGAARGFVRSIKPAAKEGAKGLAEGVIGGEVAGSMLGIPGAGTAGGAVLGATRAAKRLGQGIREGWTEGTEGLAKKIAQETEEAVQKAGTSAGASETGAAVAKEAGPVEVPELIKRMEEKGIQPEALASPQVGGPQAAVEIAKKGQRGEALDELESAILNRSVGAAALERPPLTAKERAIDQLLWESKFSGEPGSRGLPIEVTFARRQDSKRAGMGMEGDIITRRGFIKPMFSDRGEVAKVFDRAKWSDQQLRDFLDGIGVKGMKWTNSIHGGAKVQRVVYSGDFPKATIIPLENLSRKELAEAYYQSQAEAIKVGKGGAYNPKLYNLSRFIDSDVAFGTAKFWNWTWPDLAEEAKRLGVQNVTRDMSREDLMRAIFRSKDYNERVAWRSFGNPEVQKLKIGKQTFSGEDLENLGKEMWTEGGTPIKPAGGWVNYPMPALGSRMGVEPPPQMAVPRPAAPVAPEAPPAAAPSAPEGSPLPKPGTLVPTLKITEEQAPGKLKLALEEFQQLAAQAKAAEEKLKVEGDPGMTKAELKGIYRRLATLKKILEPGQKKIKGFFNFRMDLGK